MECDLLSVLLIIFFILGFSCMYSLCTVSSLGRVSFCVVVFYYMFMCVSCFGLVVSISQVLAGKTSLMTPSCGEEITSTKPSLKRFFVFFFLLVCLCCYMFPRPFTIYNSYAYITIWPICAESAVKDQQTKAI